MASRQKLPSFLKYSYRELTKQTKLKQTTKSKHKLNEWKVKDLVIKAGGKIIWKWILSINHVEAYRVQEVGGMWGVKGGNFSLLSEENGSFINSPIQKLPGLSSSVLLELRCRTEEGKVTRCWSDSQRAGAAMTVTWPAPSRGCCSLKVLINNPPS